MSEKLQIFLSEVLDVLEPFKNTIANVMAREKDGVVKAAAKSRDGAISIEITCKGDLPGFHDKACFGSLSFLRGALASPHMKKGKIELTYGLASNGEDEVLRSIKLTGAKRYNVFYRAIDPFVNQMNRIKLPPQFDWPLAFSIDNDFVKSFDEMCKIHALAPKTGSERDDIFQLVHTDEGIEAIFGDHHHTANVVLSETVEINVANLRTNVANLRTDKTHAYFSISLFKSILKLIGKGDAIGYLTNTGLKIDTETKHATYEFVTAAKKVKATK